MRHLLHALLLSAAVLLTACDGNSTASLKPDPAGRAYELLVVSDRALWNSSLGDTLRSILLTPVPYVNQREPEMDPLPVTPSDYMGLLHKHRNTLIIKTGKEYPEPTMAVEYDRHAAPQIIVELSGPNRASVTEYLSTHRAELMHIYEMAERDRFVQMISRKNEKNLGKLLTEKFGFQMTVPVGYTLRLDTPDFLWLSYEMPLVSQGIIIYSTPYTGKSDFEADSLVARRNRFVAQIPGPVDNSHMTTAELPPAIDHVTIEGRFWAVMHNFWDVKGDFMGGPFVSYSTLDTQTKRVITIEGYIFSPKHRKRNYLREQEHLIYTVKFPSR